MAREQQIVARDFLGLGNSLSRPAAERDVDGDHRRIKQEERVKQAVPTMPALGNLPPHLFHDADSTFPSRPRVTKEHSGQNIVASFSNDELHRLLSAQDNGLGGVLGPAGASLNANTILSSMAFKGMRHPSWNKAAAIHQFVSLRHLQEERLVEKSCQNLTDRMAHLFHPSQMQDAVNRNQGNALCGQHSFTLDHNVLRNNGDNGNMSSRDVGTYGNHEADSQFAAQARRYGIHQFGHTAQVLEEQSSLAHLPALSVSNLKEHLLSLPALRAQSVAPASATPPVLRPVGLPPLSGQVLTLPFVAGASGGTQTRPLACDSSGGPTSAQLTIFYAGNVNVYDDISLDKAQEIMLLAGSGSSWPAKLMNSPAGQCAPFAVSSAMTSLSRPGSPQPGQHAPAEKLQLNAQNCQTVSSSQPAAGPPQVSQSAAPANNKQPEASKPNTPSSTSSTVPAGQPVVPRALPQARKASLARFLEKRKERVRSKAPYPITQSSSDRIAPGGFSSSNYDAASPAACDESVDEKPVQMSCGMEEVTGTMEDVSTCDMDAEEQNWLKAADKPGLVAEGEIAV